MEQKKHRDGKGLGELLTYFRPEGWGAALAMGMSALTVFTVLAVLCPAWYGTEMKYTELITGITTFSGYNKETDMRIVKILLLGIPVFYFLFCGLIQFVRHKIRIGKTALWTFVSAYFFELVLLMDGGEGAAFWGTALLLLFAGSCILFYERDFQEKEYAAFLTVCLLGYAALQSLFTGVCAILHLNQRMLPQIAYQIPAAAAGILILLTAWTVRRGSRNLEWQSAVWQVVMPAGLLGMIYFSYDYESTGELFTLFYSARYRYLMYLLVLVFAGYAAYRLVRRKGGIYPTTVVAAAMLRVFTKPDGILNIDFFHMGEMSAPFAQLESYGRLPFFDLMPIHGFCDYYYSLIDFLFLDDTYLSVNAAMTIGNLVLAAFLALVLYLTCERKEWALLFAYCFMPFLINTAGVRYIFLFASFLVLMSDKVRRSGLRYLWAYAALSIVSIAWNMSIGGAGAAAFFVVALTLYLPKALGELLAVIRERKRRQIRIYGIAYVLLAGCGIAFIPVFLKIVGYLRENTGTTLMANGMAMIEDMTHYKEYFQPGFFAGESVSFLHVFGFLIPFLACLLLAFGQKNQKLQRDSREFAVVFLICFYIIANYAFVRFDAGLRTSVLSVFFIAAFLLYIFGNGENREYIAQQKTVYPACLFLLLLAMRLTDSTMGITPSLLVENKAIPVKLTTTIMGQEVEDPIVYVTGDSVGMPKLGRGFIRGNTLQSLQNLKYVADKECGRDREYLDLTNAIADYVFLDAKMPLPYTSGYNISNERMQKRAIELLEKNPPELVVLAPYIRFDEATISLRSPLLYEYLWDAGYEPYVYENVIYLKKGKSVLFDESNGFQGYADLMHKQALLSLPSVWGSSDAVAGLEPVSQKIRLQGQGDGIVCMLDESYSGEAIDFIRIQLPPDREETEGGKAAAQSAEDAAQQSGDEGSLRLCFETDGEEHEFRFDQKGDSLLIPVYSSPYWKAQKRVSSFTLRAAEGEELPASLEKAVLTCYRWAD
ncbi:MAG: hypothetical protein IJ711_12380 [Lachnospiraceae bacterium]|nr:hypothetical protein [Lachnospiraceae bacterium]